MKGEDPVQKFDSEKAARVWQRVRNEEPVPVELSALPGFAAAENELTELLRRLSRQARCPPCKEDGQAGRRGDFLHFLHYQGYPHWLCLSLRRADDGCCEKSFAGRNSDF